jgi:hypothetical protein
VRRQEKQVCGSEGMFLERAGTLLFLCVGIFFLNQSLIVCRIVVLACAQLVITVTKVRLSGLFFLIKGISYHFYSLYPLPRNHLMYYVSTEFQKEME